MVTEPTKKLAILIPCYNEASAIGALVANIPRVKLWDLGVATQVFIVDNNSTDDTVPGAVAAGATILREKKQGKGNAVRTGFLALPTDIDFVAMLDGDGTYDPGELPRMIEPLLSDFSDVVVGSRLGGRIEKGSMGVINLLGNWVFTFMVRLVYHVNVTDVLTGYFAWKKSVVDSLAPGLSSPGFTLEMEMVTKMARLKCDIASVPVSYNPRKGTSALHPVRDGFQILGRYLKSLTWHPEKS